MATIIDAQQQAYGLANPDAVFNEDAAIAKKWKALKEEDMLIGVPIGPELPLDDGTVTQSFTSGAVLHWYGGDDVRIE